MRYVTLKVAKKAGLMLVIVFVFNVTIPSPVNSRQIYDNSLRKRFYETALDMWSGKPPKAFTVIKTVSFGCEGLGPNSSESRPCDYSSGQAAVFNMMKDAMDVGADAIIDLQCRAGHYPKDNGDFFVKNPWIAAWLMRPIYCEGTAVKYK